MFDRIVVPSDLSSDSQRAIACAEVFARAAGVPLEVVSVVDPLRRTDVEPVLAGRTALSTPHTQLRIIESVDVPEAVLGEELMADEDALWFLATHARGALGEALLGSRSEQLVRVARGAVVLVGPQTVAPTTTGVLAVALDGSKPTEAMLSSAVDLARQLGMKIRLLQVAEPPSSDGPRDWTETEYLAHLAGQITTNEPVDYDILHGHHPAKDLADYLSTHPEIGMVAVATRAATGMERLWHGSTAFDLAHHSPVPVVMYHRNPD
jgi:nucleotide-binding universal stress UspA family protein